MKIFMKILIAIILLSNANQLSGKEPVKIGPLLGLKGSFDIEHVWKANDIGITMDFGGMAHFPLEKKGQAFDLILTYATSKYGFSEDYPIPDPENPYYIKDVKLGTVYYTSTYIKLGGAYNYKNFLFGLNLCLFKSSNVDIDDLPKEILQIINNDYTESYKGLLKNRTANSYLEFQIGYMYPLFEHNNSTLNLLGLGSLRLSEPYLASVLLGVNYLFNL